MSRYNVRPYTYFEVALCARQKGRRDIATLRDFFFRQGVCGGEIACLSHKGRLKVCVYVKTPGRARRLKRHFAAAAIKGVKLRVKVLERDDWLDKWQKSYHIMPLGTQFTLVPQWEREKYRAGRRIPVFLNPRSAFGSGTHETTRLVVRLMEKIGPEIKSFLDLGAGTGILSVIAQKMGASEIYGIDHDNISVQTARENFFLNQCSRAHCRKADLKKFHIRRRVDLVAANLLTKTLLENKARILACVKNGKWLIVSGVARKNGAAFRAGFRHPALRCRKVLQGRSWMAFLFHKAA
ncbi:MAG: 50S ribosomal protein L11 methyltransferase [Candidatus Omnitrophica bacterium]|nr:50S ribosomal protein L11 methyltransferase [Candidatus Omnitrophota bacterium]